MIGTVLAAGDSIDFVDYVDDYPASDGWTLKYRLTPQFGSPAQTPVTLTATTYLTTGYRVQVTPAVTALWKAGRYTWTRWVETVTARHALNSGVTEVQPDPSALVQGYDPRTQAQRALDDAKAALANFSATNGRVKRYAIAGREMEFDASSEILSLINFWKIEVTRENAAKAVQEGLKDPRRIYLSPASAR